MFLLFSILFRWSIKFPLQNINQSETEIRGRKLSVEMYVSVLFKLKYSLRLLRRFNFIRYEKQHVRLLLLRCFCILLLNWDIRLPSLCGFHISHRKIRSNTRINTLFQVTTTRLRYHIMFTIAVVILATGKQFLGISDGKIKPLTTLTTLSYFTTVKLKSLTMLTTLFYFTTIKSKSLTTLIYFSTIKRKSLTSITTLFHFTTTKMKYLTTLTTVFLLSLLLKWNIWLRSLRCFFSLTTLTTLFYFTTIKWKSLITLTTLFYFHNY